MKILFWIMICLILADDLNALQTAKLENERYTQVRSYPAEIVTDNSAYIASKVSGFIKSIDVAEGEKVVKGQPLLTIDNEAIRNRIARYKAAIEKTKHHISSLEIELEDTKRDYNRQQNLLKDDATTKRAVQKSEKAVLQKNEALSAAQASLDEARAALREERSKLKYTTIDAPIEGYIVKKMKYRGEVVSPGEKILQIIGLQGIKVEVNINESVVGSVHQGQRVMIDLPSQHYRVEGKIETIFKKADTATKTFKIKVVPEKTQMFLPGMYATVEIPASSSKWYGAVPIGALTFRYGLKGVFVLQQGTAHFVPVKIYKRLTDTVLINDQALSGQTVILYPSVALQDGIQVKE